VAVSVTSKEQLRDPPLEAAILASIPLGLYVLDRAWRFLYLNGLAERFFAQVCGRSPEQLLGRNFWQECPEVADSAFAKEYHQALAQGRALEMECFYPALGRWFLIQATPAQDIRCVYFHDVTDRVRLEREVRLRREQLAAQNLEQNN
jgi:PAS domain S-box-containing protein